MDASSALVGHWVTKDNCIIVTRSIVVSDPALGQQDGKPLHFAEVMLEAHMCTTDGYAVNHMYYSVGGQPIACISYGYYIAIPSMTRHFIVMYIAVDYRHRRRGYASAIIRSLIDRAKHEGVMSVDVYLGADQTDMLALLKKIDGFAVVDRSGLQNILLSYMC